MDYQKTVPPTMSPYGGWVYTPVQIPPIMPSDWTSVNRLDTWNRENYAT